MDFDVMFSILCPIAILFAIAERVLQPAQGVQSLKAAQHARGHTLEEWYDTHSAAFMEGQMKFQREIQAMQEEQRRADRIIKQNSSDNILWRLFRIEVERQSHPKKTSGGMRQLLQDVGKSNRLKSSEKGEQNNEE